MRRGSRWSEIKVPAAPHREKLAIIMTIIRLGTTAMAALGRSVSHRDTRDDSFGQKAGEEACLYGGRTINSPMRT